MQEQVLPSDSVPDSVPEPVERTEHFSRLLVLPRGMLGKFEAVLSSKPQDAALAKGRW